MNPALTHGAFSWSELMTADPEKAVSFYNHLLGWSNRDMPMPQGVYHLQMIDKFPVAGIMNLPQPELPTAWVYYITVDDVDAAAKRAEELGAKVHVPPMDIPTVGRFAGILDPQGVFFHVIKYEEPAEGSEMPNVDFAQTFVTPGAFSWFQLQTSDPEAAAEFYTKLLGWEVVVSEMPSGPYREIKVNGAGMGGIMPLWSDEVPPHWSAYVTVDDADAVAAAAKSSGATVIVPPTDIEKVGRFATVQDPTGGILNVIKYVPMPEPA
ncbi:MAG: VOC family protein [Rhodothermales bacterium]|nr:VOC family protein [Rhodothermales bacterium]